MWPISPETVLRLSLIIGGQIMDEDAKKTALRMIPYGMYVLTSKSQDGQEVSAATVNWLTQTSFAPPLVAVGVKGDSTAHAQIGRASCRERV